MRNSGRQPIIQFESVLLIGKVFENPSKKKLKFVWPSINSKQMNIKTFETQAYRQLFFCGKKSESAVCLCFVLLISANEIHLIFIKKQLEICFFILPHTPYKIVQLVNMSPAGG